MATINRRVEYYQINSSQGRDEGLFGDKLTQICSQLTTMQREFDYKGTSVNVELIGTDASDELIRGVFTQNRTTAPTKRERGYTETTSVELARNEGICEKTYFIYCPATSLICVEYNYHGPKVSLILNGINKLYKDELDHDAIRSTYQFVLSHTATQKVFEHHRVRSVTAKLTDPSTIAGLDIDAELPDVCEMFRPPEGGVITFKIKSRFRATTLFSVNTLRQKYLRSERDLEYYDKLNVEVEDDQTGKAIMYDLIKDKLQDNFPVRVHDGTNEVDQASIIESMGELFNHVREQYRVSGNGRG